MKLTTDDTNFLILILGLLDFSGEIALPPSEVFGCSRAVGYRLYSFNSSLCLHFFSLFFLSPGSPFSLSIPLLTSARESLNMSKSQSIFTLLCSTHPSELSINKYHFLWKVCLPSVTHLTNLPFLRLRSALLFMLSHLILGFILHLIAAFLV